MSTSVNNPSHAPAPAAPGVVAGASVLASNAGVAQEQKVAPAKVTPDAPLDALRSIPHSAYSLREAKFHFKKNELGEKRPTVLLQVPSITLEGLVGALQDEKQRSFIIDIINNEIIAAARVQVNDEQKPVNKQEDLDVGKLLIEALANEPKGERVGRGIAKELWEGFAADYISIMPAIQNKTAEQVGNAAKLFLTKLQACKTNKPVLAVMQKYLDLWFSSTPNADEFQECYSFLADKAETFLNVSDEKLLENL